MSAPCCCFPFALSLCLLFTAAGAAQSLLLTASGLVEVDVDALQLEVAVSMVGAGGINTVLVRDHLPELQAGTR